MNQPDRYERFMLPEGVRKVEFERDQKHENTGVYIIQREDHTVGNLIRMKLHEDDAVVFAGYRIPHPLNPVMHVRIQTNGTKTPQQAMEQAVLDLRTEVQELKAKLQAQIRLRDSNPLGGRGGAAPLQQQQQQQYPGGMAPQQQQYQGGGYYNGGGGGGWQ